MLKANQKIDDEIITNAEIIDKAKLKKTVLVYTIMRFKEKKVLMPLAQDTKFQHLRYT
jgi:hypothetical protein